MGFEKGVIKSLASSFEAYAPHLLNINENMKDLMIPFQNRWYSTPEMKGSYSIKYILPALVPEFAEAYESLDLVHNGGEAMNAYASLGELDEVLKVRIREALLAYCRLDTLAMVEILKKLKGL